MLNYQSLALTLPALVTDTDYFDLFALSVTANGAPKSFITFTPATIPNSGSTLLKFTPSEPAHVGEYKVCVKATDSDSVS